MMYLMMQRIISCINIYIIMPRITVDVSDALLAQIDADAKLQKYQDLNGQRLLLMHT